MRNAKAYSPFSEVSSLQFFIANEIVAWIEDQNLAKVKSNYIKVYGLVIFRATRNHNSIWIDFREYKPGIIISIPKQEFKLKFHDPEFFPKLKEFLIKNQ